MTQNWEYFTKEELQCKCGCEECRMDEDFMIILISTREEFDRPMHVTSGYRESEYNAKIGGAEGSPHLHGRAVDIAVFLEDAFDLIRCAQNNGMTGIGIKQNGIMNGRFIHLDNMPPAKGRPRPTVWSY